MKANLQELTKQIIKQGILKFGDFTLKSGKKSWFYLDLRLISSFPDTFNFVIKCYKKKLKEIGKYDAVVGVAVAGVPFSAVLGYTLNIPSLIIRTQKKDHGLRNKIEGFLPEKSTIVLIDDLITTGSSKIPGILALREMGYVVKDMLVLVDRSQGHSGQIDQLGVKLHSFASIEQIFTESLHLDDDILDEKTREIIAKNLRTD
ncbi:MAG: orotate phosphoribosyltransferase [Candidatus Heimdallarchaeota archaeon]|nr:orotate phosphoribosyltransferase [Candidatus Heimdallarchaeota archaeon]